MHHGYRRLWINKRFANRVTGLGCIIECSRSLVMYLRCTQEIVKAKEIINIANSVYIWTILKQSKWHFHHRDTEYTERKIRNLYGYKIIKHHLPSEISAPLYLRLSALNLFFVSDRCLNQLYIKLGVLTVYFITGENITRAFPCPRVEELERYRRTIYENRSAFSCNQWEKCEVKLIHKIMN